MRAIDVSNWTGRLGPDTIRCIRDAGYEHVIVRGSLETTAKAAIAQQQIEACQTGGLGISIYLWCYPATEPANLMVSQARPLYEQYQPSMWWLDMEDEDGHAYNDPASNIRWLHQAVTLLQEHGLPVGIYTGRWWWEKRNRMAGTTEFSHLPLWCAEYDGIPDRSVWTPFGGWSEPAIKQYEGSGSARVCGLAVDLNEMDPNLVSDVTGTPPEVEMPGRLTYDPETPSELQVQDWTCSIRTATWMLRSVGIDVQAGDMEHEMVEARLVNSRLGLLDGSGAALRDWLARRFGLVVHNWNGADWEWLYTIAGGCPIGIGGRAWNHWVAVRAQDGDGLSLMNPAPGFRGIFDHLSPQQYQDKGPFSVVWIPTQQGEDPVEDEVTQEEYDALQEKYDELRGWTDGVTGQVHASIRELREARRLRQWTPVRRAENELTRLFGEPPTE